MRKRVAKQTRLERWRDLRDFKLKHKLNATAAAKVLGVSKATINAWMAERIPVSRTAAKLMVLYDLYMLMHAEEDMVLDTIARMMGDC